MPESFRTRSYHERASTNLGVGDYFKNMVVYVLMPVVGVAAGLGLRKVTGLSFLQQPYEGVQGFMRNPEARRGAIAWANRQKTYVMRNAEVWGFGIGGFFGAYNLWRNVAKTQLDVGSITGSVEKLRTMESANQFFTRENEQLRRQLSFRDRLAAETPEDQAQGR